MKRLLIAVAAVAATLALAACGSGGSSSGSSAPSSMGTATVSVEQVGNSGRVLVDSAGKALYASDQEAMGKVVCTDGCTQFWVPLTIATGKPTGNSVAGKLGVTERPDGTRQVTLDGKPLYSFVQDKAGQVTGDGFSDSFDGQQFTWHVVTASGATSSNQQNTGGGAYGY